MKPLDQFALRAALIAVAGAAISIPACFVSIDESLIKDGSRADAGPDTDATTQDVRQDQTNGQDVADVQQQDQHSDAPPDTTSDDVHQDVIDDRVVSDGPPVEGGDGGWADAPLQACYGDAWCPPVGCKLRKCENGVCVPDGTMGQEVTSFKLPASLLANQGGNQYPSVAVHGYLVALTSKGLAVFNTRNPSKPFLEKLFNVNKNGTRYRYVTRTGNRVWLYSYGQTNHIYVAWLDLPLDGVSPVPAPVYRTLQLPRIDIGFGGPNGLLHIYYRSQDSHYYSYFARFRPGLPTTLIGYQAADIPEKSYVVATSGSRAILRQILSTGSGSSTRYQLQFHLQDNIGTPRSERSQYMTEVTMSSRSSTAGYFASSRNGAVAWIIGRYESNRQWSQIRAYWLTDGADKPLNSAVYNTFENFGSNGLSQQPFGPVAFIDNNTIATIAKTSLINNPDMLVILTRKSGNPSLVTRISANGLFSPTPRAVAGDDGYAYLISKDTVRVYNPACH